MRHIPSDVGISETELKAAVTLKYPGRSPCAADEEQAILSSICPTVLAISADDHVFFLRHLHRLAAPLGHRRRRLQLDREPHRWNHFRLAASDDAILIVPEPDERPSAVAVQADRVRIHRP